jgi:hypothetical protein
MEEEDDVKSLALGPLSEDHVKLLYLISHYAQCAESLNVKETWIRKTSLLVLIYEGVVAKVFDFDYAPSIRLVGQKYIWLNVSQEGMSTLDDLIETGFVNTLKLSARECASLTAYQVSLRGLGLIRNSTLLDDVEKMKKPVEDLVFDSVSNSPIFVGWNDDELCFDLYIKQEGGRLVLRKSSATDCEDVSYISSPYLPSCLFGGQLAESEHALLRRSSLMSRMKKEDPSSPKTPGIFHKTNSLDKIVSGVDNIRDELEELVHLKNPKVLMGEWIPFGENQILALNDKLGSAERVQGGLLTAIVDDEPESMIFECKPGLTSVRIVDFDLFNFIAFQAEIHFPEDAGILQLEHFGMFVTSEGAITYGLQLKNVLGSETDAVSLDHLARVLMDIRQDSSQIMDSLLSAYQRHFLNELYYGLALNRTKYQVLICDYIHPVLSADGYVNDRALKNEFNQVLGETQCAVDLFPAGVTDLLSDKRILVVMGREGILVVGKDAPMFESYLVSYLNLMARSLFMQSFFSRSLTLQVTLSQVRSMIETFESDPTSIPRIRMMHSQTEKVVILMAELLTFLKDLLLNRMTGGWSVVDLPWAQRWIVAPLMHVPGLWFALNILLWVLIGLSLARFMTVLAQKSQNILQLRIKLNLPIDSDAMELYVAQKGVSEEGIEMGTSSVHRKVTWDENLVLQGREIPVSVNMQYDIRNSFLLSISFILQKQPGLVLNESILWRAFKQQMTNAGVLQRLLT